MNRRAESATSNQWPHVCASASHRTPRSQNKSRAGIARTRFSLFDKIQSYHWALFALAAAIPLTGCGDSKFSFAPVSGQVLLDGQPVSDARVVFMPRATGENYEAGPYSNGETDENGRYQLRSVETDSRDGAVVGAHRVIISTRRTHLDPDEPDIEIIDSPESIPWPYTNYKKTPLSFEVPEDGSTQADFNLDGQLGQPSRNSRQR